MDIATTLLCAEMAIKELLDSSSSDDDELILALLNPTVTLRPKSFVETVIHAYSDADFIKNLRVSRDCVNYLIERYVHSYSIRNYQGGKIQTSIETQVLAFLWFSGSKRTYREVANVFNMSLSTVHRCLSSVLKFLVDDLAPEVIKLPRSEEEKDVIANGFERVSGIPNILGCVDRTFIAIKTPKHVKRSKCVNRQHDVSITLQGVCDSNLMFLDIFTGICGKMHDSEVLRHSFIGKELPRLCSSKYHLLGDLSYSISEHVLTPYRDDGSLSDSEKNFNLHFWRSRDKIENAFHILKCRFRQLKRMDFRNVETMEKFVTACCALHNVCIARNEPLPDEVSDTELCNNDDQFMKSGIKENREFDFGISTFEMNHNGEIQRLKIKINPE